MFQVQTIFVIVLFIICSCFSQNVKETDANNIQNKTLLRVYNFTTQIVTKYNAILTWNVENLDEHYPKDYVVNITYRSACDMTWQILNINEQIVQNRNENQFIYSFEILCPNKLNKITLSTNSTYENITILSLDVSFNGLPREPFFSPIIDPGSFSIDKNGKLHLYWKRIDDTDCNGDNYKIQITNEFYDSTHHSINQTIDKKDYYATLEKDQFNTTLGAKYKLLSSNAVGPAKEASLIEIPSIDRLCGKPENIQVVQLRKDYHVTWTKPIGDYDITSYTVFWCSSSDDSSKQCDSPIDFERVNGMLQFNRTSSDRHFKFAVSANTDSSTSGMIWEQCKAGTVSTRIGQIEPLQNVTTSTNKIELKWKPKCEDRFIVQNYIVEYCPVKDMNSECSETKISQLTSNTTYSLDNLEPNTLYRVIVMMLSETTKGPSSSPQYFTTALPVWQKFAYYIILGVFLLISSGISVYWSYCKITKMKDIKVIIPFGLDLDKEHFQKKTYDQTIVAEISMFNERLSVILEAETLDIASDQSSTVEHMKSNRKGSIQSQDSAVTVEVQDEIIEADPASGISLCNPPLGNFIIHPTLNTESTPILMVEPSYSRECSEEETVSNSDSRIQDNTHPNANGYVLLPNIASQIKGYTPMVRLVSEPKPPVFPNHGSYVNMNRLSLPK